MYTLAAPASESLSPLTSTDELRPVQCTARALPHPRSRAAVPQVFRMEQLGMHSSFLDAVAARADELPWDHYDVARRRRQTLQRYRSILTPVQCELLDACDGASAEEKWPLLLASLRRVLRDALLRVQPHRRRALRKYLLTRRSSAGWQLQPLADTSFEQPATAGRAPRRVFAPLAMALTYHPDMLRLISGVAETIHERCGASQLQMAVHQMMTVASTRGAAEPAPEGLHQDGADYIVSALVVRRRDIRGGLSRVRRGTTGPVLLEYELGEGEGLFQPDTGSSLWHEVSAIHAEPPHSEGYRMILGIDARVLATPAP